ncbi:MAG TPA: HAMP domain-containing sensor histidine kinase, partial [Candidatus Binataceae bacterium]|nr:HAMP domain-containing sensor histidine kinase [Candidatus Binataceae bacterium]
MDAKDQLIVELREAISARDDFLAVAAHELRNPLTPIVLSVQLLRFAHESGDLGKASVELDRLESLVGHFASRTQMLLKIVQISTSKFEVELSQINLSQLVANVINDYLPLVTRSGSEMIIAIQEGIIASLDPMAVSGIVENLLTNAIKYGRSQPIEVTVTAADGLAQIAVRDYGLGIAEADTARIFERFERAVSRNAHSGFGVG